MQTTLPEKGREFICRSRGTGAMLYGVQDEPWDDTIQMLMRRHFEEWRYIDDLSVVICSTCHVVIRIREDTAQTGVYHGLCDKHTQQ